MPFRRQNFIILSLFILPFSAMAMPSEVPGLALSPDSTSVVASSNLINPGKAPSPDTVVNYGKLFLKTPYRYGASGASAFDCSGFTSFVYRNFGYDLEHSSAEQAEQFDAVKRNDLKVGDLVYFAGRRKSKRVGHVGMVVETKEDGKFDFIHASTQGGVIISSSEEPYYSSRYIKANRVLGGIPRTKSSSGFAPDEPETGEYIIQPDAAVVRSKKTIPAEYHSVRSGETLSSIAEKYGITVAELKEKNGLRSNKLNLKQKLKVKDSETYTEIASAPETKQAEEIAPENNEATTALQASTHKVKRGESVFSIARLYNIPVNELKKLNNITNGRITAGQELQIPGQTTASETALAEATPKSASHQVVSGESLFSIAKKYNITVSDLKKANNLSSNSLHAGQILTINSATVNPVGEISATTPESNEIAIAEPATKESATKSAIAAKQALLNARHVAKAETEKTAKPAVMPELEPGTRIINHKVHAGENLNTLARDFKVSVDELKRINNLTETRLTPGQEVIILISPSANKTAPVIASAGLLDNFTSGSSLTAKAPETQPIAKVEPKTELKRSNIQPSTVDTKEPETQTYKVGKGETLSAIARKFGTTVAVLKELNGLTRNSLSYGQQLKVTGTDEIIVAKTESPAKEHSATTHKVQKGDNLNSIASRYNMTADELKEINNLTGSSVKFGQTLRLTKEKQVEKSNSATSEYKVQKGDNLGAIAKKFGTTVENLKKINALTGNSLQLGQMLKISSDNKEKQSSEKQLSKSTVHKVKKGESLFTIAREYGLTVDELKEMNEMSDSKISYGQELIVTKNESGHKKTTDKQELKEKTVHHKVKSGESLYSIAKKYNCTINDLKEWNPQAGKKLDIGDEVIVRN